MKVKDETVNIWGLDIAMQPVLKLADIIWKQNARELVVTSARDHIHSAGSLHYYGRAVDLRIWGLEDKIEAIATRLREGLGKDYDVIVHTTHLHVEYDPK